MGVCQIEEQPQNSSKNVPKSSFSEYVTALISTAANSIILQGNLAGSLFTEGEMVGFRGNVLYVALLCLSPCLRMWSKSIQGRGKVTRPLPLAQPVSTLKLCQAVIINEETWANGQEMQRYWLGRLPCSEAYRLAPAWWPVVSQAAVWGEGGGGQPRCETRPPPAAVCHIAAVPEGQITGDGTMRNGHDAGQQQHMLLQQSSCEEPTVYLV